MNSPGQIALNLIGLVVSHRLVTRGHWTGFLVWCACNTCGVFVCFTTGIPEVSWLAKTLPGAFKIRATDEAGLQP